MRVFNECAHGRFFLEKLFADPVKPSDRGVYGVAGKEKKERKDEAKGEIGENDA